MIEIHKELKKEHSQSIQEIVMSKESQNEEFPEKKKESLKEQKTTRFKNSYSKIIKEEANNL